MLQGAWTDLSMLQGVATELTMLQGAGTAHLTMLQGAGTGYLTRKSQPASHPTTCLVNGLYLSNHFPQILNLS